jgi:hypothetical protein
MPHHSSGTGAGSYACCSCHALEATFSRRGFLFRSAGAAGSALLFSAVASAAADVRSGAEPNPIRNPLRVQPVLVYETPQRRKATSWRNWGAIETHQQAEEEKARIDAELKLLAERAEFPISLLPLQMVSKKEQVAAVPSDYDMRILYAAGGGVGMQEALCPAEKWNVMFVRHRSGPVYLWYEIAHPRFLRKTVDEYGQPGMTVDDVVVDSQDDLLWRMRALYGLKNTLGKRVVAVGGASGWGQGGRKAPEISRTQWKFEIVDLPYPELGEKIKQFRADTKLVERCRAEADAYLAGSGVKLETQREFVSNAFLLTAVFRDVLVKAGTDAITINNCMGTIMPISETTACLPLSLLNDEGLMAFCESDFVVVPSGVLLHEISGKPVFLNDPTYPHHGVVTLAHCTAPRKMDGKTNEAVRILTHFESDYGAAPKVEMRNGQVLTNLVPDFNNKRWVGFRGEIVDSPFLPICRSQIDVKIHGSCQELVKEMGGFHWMTCYGDYRREVGYALRKIGVDWLDVSAAQPSLTS